MRVFFSGFLLFFCCFLVPPLFWVVFYDHFEKLFFVFRDWLKNDVFEGGVEDFVISLGGSVSRLSVVSFFLFFFGFFVFIVYLYFKSTDIFELFFLLPIIFIIPNILAIFILYKIKFFSSFFNGWFFSIVKWVFLIVIVWFSHAMVSKQISNVFNFDQVYFPIALSGGVFLYSIGVLSVLSAFLMLFFESILCFCLMAKRQFLLSFICFLVFIGLAFSISAGKALMGARGEFLVVQIAYDYDLLDYKVCVNGSGKENYRFIYLDGDKKNAMVFSNPVGKFEYNEGLIPLRYISDEDVRSMFPVYEGVVSCEYKKFNVD